MSARYAGISSANFVPCAVASYRIRRRSSIASSGAIVTPRRRFARSRSTIRIFVSSSGVTSFRSGYTVATRSIRPPRSASAVQRIVSAVRTAARSVPVTSMNRFRLSGVSCVTMPLMIGGGLSTGPLASGVPGGGGLPPRRDGAALPPPTPRGGVELLRETGDRRDGLVRELDAADDAPDREGAHDLDALVDRELDAPRLRREMREAALDAQVAAQGPRDPLDAVQVRPVREDVERDHVPLHRLVAAAHPDDARDQLLWREGLAQEVDQLRVPDAHVRHGRRAKNEGAIRRIREEFSARGPATSAEGSRRTGTWCSSACPPSLRTRAAPG